MVHMSVIAQVSGLRETRFGSACTEETTESDIVDQRGGKKGEKPRYACSHRSRPTSESMTEFRAMRDGKYKPGEAALRMKQNLEDGNPQMWDVFAYRIPAKKKDEEEEEDEEETIEKWYKREWRQSSTKRGGSIRWSALPYR